MSRIRPLMLTALAALLVTAGLGCGGGDDHKLPTGQLTKARYVKEVRGLLAAVERKNSDAKDEDDKTQVEVMRDTLTGLTDDLGKLHPPAEARAAHDELAEGMQGVVDMFVPMIQAAAIGTQEAYADVAMRPEAAAVRAHFAAAMQWFNAHDYDLGFETSGIAP
jgi:hypothetical protein